MSKCIICASNIDKVLSLGTTALANSFLANKFVDEEKYPLEIFFCRNCFHVQLGEFVSPDKMFRNYLYVSSTSDALKEHFSELVQYVLSKAPKSDSLVIDIGSNDGTLLKHFKKYEQNVLGVDPATNIAKLAGENGIDTWNDFFNEETAKEIKKSKGMAKVITGTNVFAHQPDYESFMKGVLTLLDEDGIFVIEVPYLPNLIKGLEFDTIYHEHVSYFALKPLEKLFNKFGLEIFDVSEHKIHGGSIRVIGRRGNKLLQKDNKFIKLETEMKLNSIETFFEFAKMVQDVKSKLILLLSNLKKEKKKIAGYGAAAKANTLLNYCQIDSKIIDYIADKNQLKQGLVTPGMHIPVVSPEKIKNEPPDYLIILAWNFADEIMNQLKSFSDSGGKFIIPLPEPKII